jgi:transposase-like protein
MDGTAAEGAKDWMLQDVLEYITKRCPGIMFALSDKDMSKINAVQAKIPDAKHQLCYWHAIKYLKERLAEDKRPAKYDPQKAHLIF